MHLTIQSHESAPEESRPLLRGIADDLRFVPNLAATVAASPTLLRMFDAMRRAVGSCNIDPAHREIAGLAVGVAVDNAYGVAFHSTVLLALGASVEDVERMRAGELPTDTRAAAVYAFAYEVAQQRGKVSDSTVERVTSAGFTTEDVLEIVAECSFAALVGTIDNLAGRVELDEPLQPQSWESANALTP